MYVCFFLFFLCTYVFFVYTVFFVYIVLFVYIVFFVYIVVYTKKSSNADSMIMIHGQTSWSKIITPTPRSHPLQHIALLCNVVQSPPSFYPWRRCQQQTTPHPHFGCSRGIIITRESMWDPPPGFADDDDHSRCCCHRNQDGDDDDIELDDGIGSRVDASSLSLLLSSSKC
jgi:hypothetical protein